MISSLKNPAAVDSRLTSVVFVINIGGSKRFAKVSQMNVAGMDPTEATPAAQIFHADTTRFNSALSWCYER
jgi:hypothetical protein